MKVLKGFAWSLPAVALVLGAFALTTGFSGTVSGSELVAPVEAVSTQDGKVASSKAVNSETWDQMATRYKGSPRGF